MRSDVLWAWCRVGVLAVAVAWGGWSCRRKTEIIETESPLPTEADRSLRGTIGSQAKLNNASPALVSGIGFVVGLNGTGGGPLREDLAATMVREMSLLGVTSTTDYEDYPGLSGKTPDELLRDRNTAVVFVQAVVAPGSAAGTSFDVFVVAENATSLEGGVLWSTDLRLGPPRAFGDFNTPRIAVARGPIFINPFAGEGGLSAGVNPRAGRVLDGGVVTDPLGLQLVLDRENPSTARLMTFAINSRFPELDGDGYPTAKGMDGSSIRLLMPTRYKNRPEEFVRLVEHLTIDTSYPEAYANRYVQDLRANPFMAERLSWCLQALGEPSTPFLRKLYEDQETVPRLAALRAGAGLNDPKVVGPIVELITKGPESERTDAIELLARIDGNPRVELELRRLLESGDLTTRIAAYEALVARGVRKQRALLTGLEETKKPGELRLSASHIDRLAASMLPTGMVQGVSRTLVEGKFLLDRSAVGEPMIYVTQQGEPRIAVLGEDVVVRRPMFADAPERGVLVVADSETSPVRVYYRSPVTGATVTAETSESVVELIKLLARDRGRDLPQPGLGLSYSDVVAVLHAIERAGGFEGTFATEQNRLLAELLKARERREVELRPETADAAREVVVLDEPSLTGEDDQPTPEAGGPTSMRELLVPVDREPEEDGKRKPR